MAVSETYRIESAVYLVLYFCALALALLELRADFARKKLKRPINAYHHQQHCLQVAAGLLGIVESLDPSATQGIFVPWQVGLVDGILSVVVITVLEMDVFLMLASQYWFVGSPPTWLIRALSVLTGVFGCFFIPAETFAGFLGHSVMPFVCSMALCVLIVVQCVLVDCVYVQLWRAVSHLDRMTVSNRKALPQLKRVGRVLLGANIILFAVSAYLAAATPLYSWFIAPPPPDGSFLLNLQPFSTWLILCLSLWWSFHPLCPKPKTRLSRVTSSRPRRSTTAPSHPSANPDADECTEEGDKERQLGVDPSSSNPSTTPNELCGADAGLAADPDSSEHGRTTVATASATPSRRTTFANGAALSDSHPPGADPLTNPTEVPSSDVTATTPASLSPCLPDACTNAAIEIALSMTPKHSQSVPMCSPDCTVAIEIAPSVSPNPSQSASE